MIRQIEEKDVEVITDIYNNYIVDTVVTFEVDPITKTEMSRRVADISSCYPYFVYEENGEVAGYCYAHPWKVREAYKNTLETTVYVSPKYIRKGIGNLLMRKLIDVCKGDGYKVLIACITEENKPSIFLHEALGFKKVSHFEKVGMKFGRELDVVDYELKL